MASIKFANTYDTAGLDVAKLPKLKEAITAYSKKLENLSEKLDTTKNSEWDKIVKNAIRGTNAEAGAKSYITSICNECKNNIKLLNSFATALNELEKKYKNNDTSSSSISLESGVVRVTH